MKRIIAILSALVLMLSAVVPAVAEADARVEVFHNQSDVASATVQYGISESYLVSIPAQVGMSVNAPTAATASASGVKLPRAKTLTVKLSGSSYADGSWHVGLTQFPEAQVSYSIKNGEAEVKSGDTLFTCPGGTPTGRADMTFTVTGKPGMAGNYMDMLTFVVSIDLV